MVSRVLLFPSRLRAPCQSNSSYSTHSYWPWTPKNLPNRGTGRQRTIRDAYPPLGFSGRYQTYFYKHYRLLPANPIRETAKDIHKRHVRGTTSGVTLLV